MSTLSLHTRTKFAETSLTISDHSCSLSAPPLCTWSVSCISSIPTHPMISLPLLVSATSITLCRPAAPSPPYLILKFRSTQQTPSSSPNIPFVHSRATMLSLLPSPDSASSSMDSARKWMLSRCFSATLRSRPLRKPISSCDSTLGTGLREMVLSLSCISRRGEVVALGEALSSLEVRRSRGDALGALWGEHKHLES